MSDATTGTGKKKGLGPIAWIAIGCGGLLLIGVIAIGGILGWGFFKAKEIAAEFGNNPARAAAETFVRLDPDLELIETDEAAGTVTFRNMKTGEVATLNFEDIAEGRFSMTTAEGEYQVDASEAAADGAVTFKGPEGEARLGASTSPDDIPVWVPGYPGASASQGGFNARSAQGTSGIVSFTTEDGMADVVAYYKQWFEDEGYAINSESSTHTPQGGFSGIAGESASTGRSVNVVAAEQGGTTQITINYNARSE